MPTNTESLSIGWIGTGRMGYEMAARLAQGGADILAWNRTRAKAEPLTAYGAKIAGNLAELASRDIVFCMVSAWDDVKQVMKGLLDGAAKMPRLVIECSSISLEGSEELRRMLEVRGIAYLAAPVSGNAKVIKAGRLSFVCSGPQRSFEEALPYYVGEGELARICKIAHNVMLGVVIENLIEITLLANKMGVPRHAFLAFMNNSVMGSTFTRYKTPAFVNLDFKVTFTPQLLRKDMDLGLDAGRRFEVPLPLASMTRDLIQQMIGRGWTGQDFATLLLQQAEASALKLEPENVDVGDGLSQGD